MELGPPGGTLVVSALQQGWLVHEDAELVVANKLAGIAVRAPELGSGADLLSRIARERNDLHAGELWPLDDPLERDVSGLVVLARSRQARARLSEAVQRGEVVVKYVVATTGGALPGPRGKLSAVIAKAKDGSWHKAERGERGRKVELAYEVLDCQRERRLLRVVMSGAGPRHARAVLQAHGSVVAGDAPDSCTPVHRVRIHAESIEMPHPADRRPVRLKVPLPIELSRWCHHGGRGAPEHAAELIRASAVRRFPLVASGQVQAWRAFHGEGEGLPGLDLDIYGNHAVAWIDEELPAEVSSGAAQAAKELGAADTIVKIRPRARSQASPSSDESEIGERVRLSERGMCFEAWLKGGLATGWYADQRGNRAWVRENARGLSVLNLFAYTCSFTVAAALGGAARTVSVDVSSRALTAGRTNLELNGIGESGHEFVCTDVLTWVRKAAGAGDRFGLIVLDPPSFSTTRQSRWSVERDYADLAREVVGLLSVEGGVLIACTNHRGTTLRRLRGWVRSAVAAQGRSLRAMRATVPELDFPPEPGAEPHMKSVVAIVEPLRTMT